MTIVMFIFVLLVLVAFLSYRYPTTFPPFLRSWINFLVDEGLEFSVIYIRWAAVIGAILSLLVVVSILIASPVFYGIVFLLAVLYVYAVVFLPDFVVWLIVNSLYIIGVTVPRRPYIFPASTKVFAGWIAFFGLLAVTQPGLISIKLMIIISLVSFIVFAFIHKKAQGMVIPLTVILLLIAAWKWSAPDNFRAVTRHIAARGEQVNTGFDRSSIETEGNAAVTYARLNRSVAVIYKASLSQDENNKISITALTDVPKPMNINTLVKVFNHKSEILIFEGQGFVEIQLSKKTGSFVKGERYWIEADALDLVTPTELNVSNEVTLVKLSNTEDSKISGYFYDPGRYPMAPAGGETGLITIGPCRRYYFDNNGARVTLYYQDGTHANSWEINKWPDKSSFWLKNWSQKSISLIII